MTNQRKPYSKIPSIKQDPELSQWVCTACNKSSSVEASRNGLDLGLELSGFAGYYAGFTDTFDVKSQQHWDECDRAYFCHSCCCKLFKLFPKLAINVGIEKSFGHHPCDNDTPCCDYSWTIKRQDGFTTILAAIRDKDNNLIWTPKQVQADQNDI